MAAADADALSGPRIVEPAASLRGSLHLPADKSVAHRALLFDAMGSGSAVVTLHRPGHDVLSMAAALRSLGAVESMATDDAGTMAVHLRGSGRPDAAMLPGSGGERLDCGNAGTAMRLLAGALAGRPSAVELRGDASLSGRPMERIAAPLRAMGAQVDTRDGHAPLRIVGRRPLRALRHEIGVASAQVIGCLASAGLAADGTTCITVSGPTRDHTERMLGWLGAPVRREGLTTWVDGPAGYLARSLRAPGDISAAAVWLVAAALHPEASVVLHGVGLNPSRLGIVEVLRDMGADIEVGPEPASDNGPEPVGSISIRGGRTLTAIDIATDRVADVIDELPLIGVAMAAAEGTSQLRDAAELRVKESDRIALTVEGLAAVGADVEELPDGWVVRRGPPRDADIRTAGDHRIAMAFAVAALSGVAGTLHIDDPACAAVSYPGFWTDVERLAA